MFTTEQIEHLKHFSFHFSSCEIEFYDILQLESIILILIFVSEFSILY